MSRFLIVAGVLLVLAGLLWPWIQKIGLGRLPGDIVWEGKGVRIYVPVVTMLLLSLVVTLLVNLFVRR